MNIASNPWSFTSADVASSTAAASPTGMVQQGAAGPALGSVLYTATGAHNLAVGNYVTYINDTNSRFLGFYQVQAVPSATTALLQNLSSPKSGQSFSTVIAASGGGTMLVCPWPWMIRAEDISLQNDGTAPGTAQLILLDRNGNVVWTASVGTAAETTNVAQNRGKILWIDGFTPQLIPTHTTVLITVN
jgi:hypothetical protein